MGLLRALGRLVFGTVSALRRGLVWVVRGIAGAGHRTVLIIVKASRILWQRWDEDLTFRRTLLASGAAIIATLLPHPAIAAALAAVVADRPRMGRRPLFDEDEDQDWPRRESHSWRDSSAGSLWTG